MSFLPGLKIAYRVLRSVLFAIIAIVAFLYVGLYVALSIPSVQNKIKTEVEREASNFLGAELKIDNLMVMPFSELKLRGVTLFTPKHEPCIKIENLGAGINIWCLIYDRKVEITYGEIIGLDAHISKTTPESPLNIQFIIDAVSPKDKNKPPTPFDLKLHSVVIRKSAVAFDILSAPHMNSDETFDPNHIRLNNLRADVALPRLKNDDFTIDLRRLSFNEQHGFRVERLTAFAHITARSLDVSKISLRLPATKLTVSDVELKFDSLKNIKKGLETGVHSVIVNAQELSPADFASFFMPLNDIKDSFEMRVDLEGNLKQFVINSFDIAESGGSMRLSLRGRGEGLLPDAKVFGGRIDNLELNASEKFLRKLNGIIPGSNDELKTRLDRLTELSLKLAGEVNLSKRNANLEAALNSNLGSLLIDGDMRWTSSHSFRITGDVDGENMNLGALLNKSNFGETSFSVSADMSVENKNVEGNADVTIAELTVNSIPLNNISLTAEKQGDELELAVDVNDEIMTAQVNGSVLFAKENSRWNINGEIENFVPSKLNILPKYNGYELSGTLRAGLVGNNPDNITGEVSVGNFSYGKIGNKGLYLKSLNLSASATDSMKMYSLDSDIVKGTLKGNFTFSNLANLGKKLLSEVSPSFMPFKNEVKDGENAEMNLTVIPNASIADFFNLKYRPYTDVSISGITDSSKGELLLSVKAPYILKGKDKLIRNSSVSIDLKEGEGLAALIESTVPAKNDAGNMKISLSAFDDRLKAGLGWIFEKNSTARGRITFDGMASKNILTGKPEFAVNINPSEFELNGSTWSIDRSHVTYADNAVNVEDLRIWHSGQFVNINGTASDSELDALKVKLAGIDLSYVFEALNINYVNFGGIATGEISASNLFSKMPVLRTESLFVKDLSYNGAVLGDGRLESHWVNELKKVAINADVREGNRRSALIGGGVYIGRDSLAFDILADKVNVEFLKPFMAAFTSDVGGRASGRVKLYGTFKDIDLAGDVYADSICMKVDYTNVYYHGSDSVYIRPGKIEIPNFRLYDKYGNSGMFTGTVSHRYFHDPEFEFRLSGAQNLLAFDTNPYINPDWYGKIYASGGGSLRGRPGYISILMDVTTAPGSDFTFVLSETQTAGDYSFLTFSDKKKEAEEILEGNISVEEQLLKSLPVVDAGAPSVFAMDIRCTVTPGAAMNLIMDPKAGDKITARGEGPLQIAYDTESDEMKIYGKYTLAEGNYNFSLQDLILRDFKIYPGSNISFNGDPMQGILDITAAYRVNTNLSDLDKSFSTDRDLNRTNVPVDALLKVTGDMRAPEIGFDIALPTLTQDVERKVKSIISTEDMMSKQIIYLLALNRFYTPEYMSTSGNGGELASVASSTLSSQLSSFMGQLTDKFTLAPSFRSDKGDFSDMEVDLALSSRLLDNRLLINGNFGYRDRSTSQSTFVGDFDIEYLLNRNGGLRLKAYNHFNDQNYYLRSALTTQGIGVIYRRDFDNPFTFLRRKKSKNKNTQKQTNHNGTAESK